MNDLTPLQKLPKNVEFFGQINCSQWPYKVAQSSKNRPIWSHCSQATTNQLFSAKIFLRRICFHHPNVCKNPSFPQAGVDAIKNQRKNYTIGKFFIFAALMRHLNAFHSMNRKREL